MRPPCQPACRPEDGNSAIFTRQRGLQHKGIKMNSIVFEDPPWTRAVTATETCQFYLAYFYTDCIKERTSGDDLRLDLAFQQWRSDVSQYHPQHSFLHPSPNRNDTRAYKMQCRNPYTSVPGTPYQATLIPPAPSTQALFPTTGQTAPSLAPSTLG